MGQIRFPKPVLLISAVCFSDDQVFDKSLAHLEGLYGPVQVRGECFKFSHTSYYLREMGSDLKKIYIAFERLVDPGVLATIKIFANQIEKENSSLGKRLINIDPGYIEAPKLVLATTKNYAHRIYIGQGIYGDVQLFWREGHFRTNPWTYPDYQEPKHLEFFEKLRKNYMTQIN